MAITTLSYKTDSDVVKTEGPNRYSRDEWELPANFGAHPVGTVISKITATGVPAIFDPEGEDGEETPLAVLLESVEDRTAAQRVVVLSRHAEVVRQALVWPAGTTNTEITAALVALEERGIVARQGV